MDEQTDIFNDLLSVSQFDVVPDPTREILDKALMRIVLSPYSKPGDIIKASELLCKKRGYLSPEKHELTGANGEPILQRKLSDEDMMQIHLKAKQLDDEY
jgi:hypothetical protein